MEYTIENYENAKKDDIFIFKCKYCGKEFEYTKRQIQKNSKNIPYFCSKECYRKYKAKKFVKTKCAKCGKELIIEESVYNRSKSKNFFCSISHSAAFNNPKRIVTEETKEKISKGVRKYLGLDTELERKEKRFYDKCPQCGKRKYKKSELCRECRNKEKRKTYRALKLSDIIGDAPKYKKRILYNGIRTDARKEMKLSNIERVCCYCHNHEFDQILDVHHIKGISTFDINTTIDEINDIHNLVWLCPNHHKMLEKGLITLNNDNKEK